MSTGNVKGATMENRARSDTALGSALQNNLVSDEAMEEFSKALEKRRSGSSTAHEDILNMRVTPQEKMKQSERDVEVEKHRTWRQHFPVLRKYEYWQLKADTYPYIRRAEQHDDFLFRGVSMTPRLSEYPMCRDIIREYFTCRDSVQSNLWLNICTPVKEQMSACINETFIKNHKRLDKKMNAKRDEEQEARRMRKFDKMVDATRGNRERREKFQD